MTYIENNNEIIITTDNYTATLSKKHGGTLRNLIYKGIDTGLTREGCEYWSGNNDDHYEQEYSNYLKINYIHESQNEIKISLQADLISPQLKITGGTCEVFWIFEEEFIKHQYSIHAIENIAWHDKYFCFYPNFYKFYSFYNSKIYKDIPLDFTWKNINKKCCDKHTWLQNEKLELNFLMDKKLSYKGLYNSHSMLELKQENHSNDIPYKIKSKLYMHYKGDENEI